MLLMFFLITSGHHFAFSTKQQLTGPHIQIWIYGLTAIFFLVLITLIRYYSLHQICFAFYLISPLVIGFSIPFITWFPAIYDLIITFWIGGSFFFFWAYANNHFSFRQAGLYYPLFIIISVASQIFKPQIPFNLVLTGILMTICAVAIFLLFLFTFFRLKWILHEEDCRGPGIDEMFEIIYRVIIGGLIFSLVLLMVLNQQFMAIETLWRVVILCFLPILSVLLFSFQGTSWRFTAYGILFTVIVTYWSGLSLIQLLTPLVLLLKEMSFIAVPKCSRFLTKTWVDLFFTGCGLGAGHLLLFAPNPVGLIAIIVAMATYAITTHLAGVRLETFTSK